MCVRPTHKTYYKKISTRVNTKLALLLYVCVAHTYEPNLRRTHPFFLPFFPFSSLLECSVMRSSLHFFPSKFLTLQEEHSRGLLLVMQLASQI